MVIAIWLKILGLGVAQLQVGRLTLDLIEFLFQLLDGSLIELKLIKIDKQLVKHYSLWLSIDCLY